MERVDFRRVVIVHCIQKALGLTLWENQIHYLAYGTFLDHGRRTGKTTACCIKLALSKGEPLDMRRPETFSDGWYRGSYPQYFKREFLEIRSKLKQHGFPVREITK